MSEMLERVARALFDQTYNPAHLSLDDAWTRNADDIQGYYRTSARVAIAAMDPPQISEMVARVAAAIAKAAQMPTQILHKPSCQCGQCVAFRLQAGAAIKAMREPTERMVVVGDGAISADAWCAAGGTAKECLTEIWHDMIDEALR